MNRTIAVAITSTTKAIQARLARWQPGPCGPARRRQPSSTLQTLAQPNSSVALRWRGIQRFLNLGGLLLSINLITGAPSIKAQPNAGAPTIYRGEVFHLIDDPRTKKEKAHQYIEDAGLLVENGRIKALGSYNDIASKYRQAITRDYRGYLISPGFIDTHVHYPQSEVIGAYGEQLLEWLNTYTFPAEIKYSNPVYAREQADFFLNELLKNGTTTALVFATVSPVSVNAFFEAALARNMRMISGKVLMDRNAPAGLLDTTESSYIDSKKLIQKWHGLGRLSYAITPRFAPTSTPAQLEAAGKLKAEFPSVYVHTHLSENPNEIAWVKQLFPERKGYLDVYDYYKLTGSRSVFAHGVHLEDEEVQTLHKTQSVISFCPTSNLFLGSGLFPLIALRERGVRIALGTDVGAGTSLSILQTLNEGYKVAQLRRTKLSPYEGFYLATLGGARALSLDDKIGNLMPGKEADFIVLDPRATALAALRADTSTTLQERLFTLMTLGDDRMIKATYIAGVKLHERR